MRSFSVRVKPRRIFKDTAEAQRAKSKSIADINELNKKILGTAIEVLSAKREATVVFFTFYNLGVLCVFAVRNKFGFFFKFLI